MIEGPGVVLTGAGVSAESGIPTFRGEEGVWRTHRPEELATPEAFARDPTLVWEWYDWRRQLIAQCEPNPAHRVLAEMEAVLPDVTMVTQNVDGFHQAAGSRRVLELHGNIWRVRCPSCGLVRYDRRVPLPEIPPRCECGAVVRPDVVWFGESLPPSVLEAAGRASMGCRWMLVVGTSAVVQPAASLPRIAKEHGAYLIECNLSDTLNTPLFDEVLQGAAGKTLPQWWSRYRPD